ncbi:MULTISPECIES: FadR/GntR family transcriptional regulator [Actinomadura]|uniref:FadR/GntR family transcriptional regulator n=1 Tax=Actinomadura yumaensis TaxID=111807 RepID=A0ABW2CD81_9ACTN|nr:FCD domain-containing protein [Actinomadura sp. J1-007]MWK38377.1 FCD domain-containing protein [Actinomadura sp. J1-007]
MPASIKRTSLTDQATEAIIQLIQERNLRDGDQMPGTGELAEMLNVSVPVVREAVAGLSAIGLLKRHQGRESTVSTPDSTHMSRLFALRILGTSVDDEQLQQFREIVEVGNARLAARNHTPEHLASLHEALDALRSVRDAEHLHEADVAFHAAVSQAAGNDLCELTLESLEPLLRRLRRRVWNGWVNAGGRVEAIIDAHRVILTAIEAADENAAATAMAVHLEQARLGLEESICDGDHEVAGTAGFPPDAPDQATSDVTA